MIATPSFLNPWRVKAAQKWQEPIKSSMTTSRTVDLIQISKIWIMKPPTCSSYSWKPTASIFSSHPLEPISAMLPSTPFALGKIISLQKSVVLIPILPWVSGIKFFSNPSSLLTWSKYPESTHICTLIHNSMVHFISTKPPLVPLEPA